MVEDFDVDLNSLQDLDQARECIVRLLNLVEEMAAENQGPLFTDETAR